MFVPEKLLELIRLAAYDVMESNRGGELLYGTVESVSPPAVSCLGVGTVTAPFLHICTSAQEKLTPGAPVALFRCSGGQRFLLLDTVCRGGDAA